MKNKYVKRSKISEAKFRKIIMYFALELDSQKIATLTSLNRNTVNRYLNRIRSQIVSLCEDQASKIPHYATGRQINPVLDPSLPAAPDSLPVFGIQSRNAHIYTEILPNGVHHKLRHLIKNSQKRRDAFRTERLAPLRWDRRSEKPLALSHTSCFGIKAGCFRIAGHHRSIFGVCTQTPDDHQSQWSRPYQSAPERMRVPVQQPGRQYLPAAAETF